MTVGEDGVDALGGGQVTILPEPAHDASQEGCAPAGCGWGRVRKTLTQQTPNARARHEPEYRAFQAKLGHARHVERPPDRKYGRIEGCAPLLVLDAARSR
jgi:hypothetical protein